MTEQIPLSGVVLDAPDPRELAKFYRQLLGWEIVQDDENWAQLRGPAGSSKISIQREPHHRPPAWPSEPDRQQMQLHLDFEISDLGEAQQRAVSAGATVMDWQPQEEGVRIFADPVGHVFCLFLPGW
ncbi:catechol 2,3-dioxygenase-like lactoylglutathione lyase family enzyme [Kribbella voronezhensis]|uniref:Catechol 2,3-dioxygenase-like lactoylglutathione lyase family enzyme n=1 Tax=Kribbella voronezhensis TaxID=2512212 RepID=A0A4V3FJX5_9ACTN|nr:VOC family protein [Kribbella voronezhensis]TDU88043.1 catechol 2,3-dioxygenase-like lactoylglutathione lyase family enzyme [Kribbella voronezhensis]